MIVNQAFKYELKPNNKQKGLLIKHCGVARFAYNWGLARRIELYKTRQGKERYTTAIDQYRELIALKKIEYPWLKDVSKSTPQEALRNLDRAYANFYQSLKKHTDMGFPQFKKKGISDNFKVMNSNYNQKVRLIEVNGHFIKLPKFGLIYTKEYTDKCNGRILSVVVSREANRWFCSLCVEVDRPILKQVQGEIVGIDLGINTFAVISNGAGIESINSPKPLHRRTMKVKKLNHQLSRKKKGSQNYKKVRLRLSRLHRKIRNTRKDFLAKESTKLAKTKSVICIEDLNVSGMLKNHHLARSIGDEGWGTFKEMLKYKTQWYGSKLVIIPRFEPSSKKCNHCGEINKTLKLSDRTWVCLKCGAVNERDPNAAHNIRDKGIKMLDTESLSELQACGVDVRPSKLMAVGSEAGIKHMLDDKTY